jgi:hypothetical protein
LSGQTLKVFFNIVFTKAQKQKGIDPILCFSVFGMIIPTVLATKIPTKHLAKLTLFLHLISAALIESGVQTGFRMTLILKSKFNVSSKGVTFAAREENILLTS